MYIILWPIAMMSMTMLNFLKLNNPRFIMVKSNMFVNKKTHTH